ncbi:hypothetical protein Bca4012_084341 [Brassica carinata]
MESSETELPASPPSDCSLVNPQSASTTASASVTLNHEVSAIKSSSTIAEEVLPLANSGLQLKQAPSHEVNKTQMIQSITAPPSPAGAPPSRAGAQDGLVVPPAVVAPLNGSALAPLGAWVKPLNWLEKSLDQIKAPLEVDWPALSGKCMGKNVHRNEQNASDKDHERTGIVDASGSLPTVDASPAVEIPNIIHPIQDKISTSHTTETSQEVLSATETILCHVSPPSNAPASEDHHTPSDTAFSSIPPAMDMLSSLATIMVLENMHNSPSIICINELIETPTPESVQKLSSATQESSPATKDAGSTIEPDFGSNKFASLINVEEEEDTLDSDDETESMDQMTPSAKRILRERPVKPSTKAKKMHWQSASRGRGNRGRGNRSRRG